MKFTNMVNYKRMGRCCFAALMLLLMVFSGTGCGKKSPPVLPHLDPLKAAGNLTYTQDNKRICLNWTFTDDADSLKLSGFRVYLNRISIDEEPCEECPVLFTRVADISAETRTYCEPAVSGFRYKYKVVGYTENGNMAPDSNIVSFDY